jgi:hypothetical protein
MVRSELTSTFFFANLFVHGNQQEVKAAVNALRSSTYSFNEIVPQKVVHCELLSLRLKYLSVQRFEVILNRVSMTVPGPLVH